MSHNEQRGRSDTQQRRPGGGERDTIPPKPPQRLPFPRPALSLEKCQNPGLVLGRYIRFQDEWQLGEYATDPQGKKKRSSKLYNLEQVKAVQDRCNENAEWKALHADFIQRWRATVTSQDAAPFQMTPDWRFITGLGEKTALEVGFTFHRLYGFPIIPGSGLKGLARLAALLEIAEMSGAKALGLQQTRTLLDAKPPQKTPLQQLEDFLLANDERLEKLQPKVYMQNQAQEQATLQRVLPDRPLQPEEQTAVQDFRRIFGTLYAEGEAIFFDAVPAKPPLLEVDVMNPHFPEYYRVDNPLPPSDSQSPKPVFFLTVGRTPFWFAVGWHGKAETETQERVVGWLTHGLEKMGAGAKTSAGYGYFTPGEAK